MMRSADISMQGDRAITMVSTTGTTIGSAF